MSQRVCCVPDCYVTINDGIPLHRFPNPEKDSIRFQNWIENTGYRSKNLDRSYVHINMRVCRRHFIEVHLYPSNRLCKLAVPTLHVPAEPTLKELDLVIPGSSTVLKKPEEVQHIAEDVNVPSSSSQPLKRSNKCEDSYEHLLKAYKALLLKNRKRDKKPIKNRKSNVNLRANFIKTKEYKKVMKDLPKPARIFFNMQVKMAKKSKKGRRFTTNEKVLALSLFKPAPKSYRLLSKFCVLPSRRTLQNMLSSIYLNTGINEMIFENLKMKINLMPENERYCCLIFDEMAISSGLHFNKRIDKIIGFVDNGSERRPEYAKHVLVFMVRGIVKKYKQPIMFSYCSGSTSTIDLKKQLKLIIEQLHEIGLRIVTTICDQGSTNVAAINQLQNETRAAYLKNNENYTGGFFEINKKKIFPIYDPPHLIKGIRNNLLTKDLKYKMNGQQHIAKWKHIEDLYKRGPNYKGVKLIPKLTAQHVVPDMIPKMRVKHCTQVFSKSVGVALGFMASHGVMPKESQDTADILIFFDDLFDSVNGSYNSARHGKKYKAAVTPSSLHHKLWNSSLAVLKTMKFIHKGRDHIVPSISSWIKTLKGFKLISKYLSSKGINSLYLRNFNQDPLENFFGAVRSHGYSNIMPTATAFEAAYKTLLINNLSSVHSIGANCEEDNGLCLQSLKHLLKHKINETEQNQDTHVIDFEDTNIELINTDALIKEKSPIAIEKTAAIAYCSGWIAKTCHKIYKTCKDCKEDLESQEETFHEFIKLKEYESKRWLCYPSRKLFDFFAHVEHVTIEILKKRASEPALISYIKLINSIIVNINIVTCSIHKEKIIDFLLDKNVTFFINNWCKDVNNILNAKATFWDKSDPFKNSAYKHCLKSKGRKRKRQTGIQVNV